MANPIKNKVVNNVPKVTANVATTVTEELELTTASVKEFMENDDFIHIHELIRENANGYLYLTFIDSANQASNVYFTEKAVDINGLKKDQELDADFFADLQMVYVEYTDEREARWKICPKGSGTRKDISFFNF